MNVKMQVGMKSALVVGLGLMIAGSAIAGHGEGRKRGGQGKGKGQAQEECGKQKCKGDKECGQKKGGHKKCKGEGKRGHGKENCPWASERDEFRKGQQAKVKAFMSKRREVMKASKETAKNEDDPQKIIAMIKANHAKAEAEAKEFFGGMEKERDEFMTSMFSKYEVSKEEQAKIREHASAKRDKMKKMHAERSKKVAEALDKLAAKDDLTKEDIRNTMRKMHGSKRGHGEKGHKQGKQGGKRRHGESKGEKRGHGGHGDKDNHERGNKGHGGKGHGQGGHHDSE
jgi:hypothetical protein